ncbi:hypothetical protein F5Y06DRAFT_254612 [Hypoxylon sp. FL0890]|nr:hypothetical protein F5Y06DRAFT_254612 [Hypoxylon sp. FL0890]
MASRYSGSRYDGDSRRSRSRDRSPDRRSLYSDGGPRRSSAESRSNSSAFQTNRDSFRDALPRDPPRGPKALLDAPTGPRGGGYSGDFRGRGRGRGRGWRDDSRDRGRDRDIDFRDRRDNSYRDERSRERDRGDWRDRDRDSFRGRRPSPRGRSPPGRDFRDSRDLRDAPLGVDADRARRGSRDGPLSAGSSSSDPPFGPSSYRGGYSSRGRGRGRGDWDRGRGRGYYDDRDRYGSAFRSRSQEGRYRDRDDRDRDNRYLDPDLRPRDHRDDRDVRDREVRPKLERTSHEPPPPSAKDVSPPPIAPAAPSFGSVPNRTVSATEVGSATGKVPPTGPRALKEERPAPSGSAFSPDARLPPMGSSRSSFLEISPSTFSPSLRNNRPGPTSKQWINPKIKNRVPESPIMNRSQSFAQPRPAGFRPDGAPSDQPVDSVQRPPSSDARADQQPSSVDNRPDDSHTMDEDEQSARVDQHPQSAIPSLTQEHKLQDAPSSEPKKEDGEVDQTENPIGESSVIEIEVLPPTDEAKAKLKSDRRPTLKVLPRHVSLPQKEAKLPILDQSSESDDEEFGDVIESQMAEVEAKLKKLEGTDDTVPMDAIVRHAIVSLEAVAKIMNEPEGLEDMVGPIPEDITLPGKTPVELDPQIERAPSVEEPKGTDDVTEPNDTKEVIQDKISSPVVEEPPSEVALEPAGPSAELPQPSIEQDVEMLAPQEAPHHDKKANGDDGDVAMEDVLDVSQPDSELQATLRTQLSASHKQSVEPAFEEAQIQSQEISKRGSSTPSPAEEDEDETDIEDVDLHTIEIVREHMATPPIESLPYFDEKPWFKDQTFLKSMDTPHPSLDAFILGRLKDEAWHRMVEETQMKKRYDSNYDNYLRFTMSDDPVAVKSREKFTSVTGSEPNSQKPGFHETKPEGTRRSRYASERDLERILEESRRVEDEKRERQMQAERERYRTEKEAVLPSQYQAPEEREKDSYRDVTGFIQAEKTVAAWQLLPPVDNFTEEETAIFEKAYLEFPKQWGKVSEPLANRDFGTSIQFYYLKKEKDELNLKEKLKKRPKQRKRGGRGKQRTNALVSELGNGDNDNEENQETGENGERRRPRRAAAPTFNSEATPATDGEGGTPAGTPGRRGASSKGDGSAEKPERKPRGRRAAKDKEAKQPRVNQTLAAAPPAGTKGNRSRSSSRVHIPEWPSQQAPSEAGRIATQYELAPSTAAVPPVAISAPFPHAQPILSPERGVPPPPPPPVSMSVDTMGPPPLRPEPPQQPPVAMLDLSQTTVSDRRSGTQASSYWSVPEANDFPQLLRSFGSDWAAIATHMRTKTPIMIKNYYTRKKDANDWQGIVEEADARKARGEKRPAPPAPSSGVKKRYETSSNRPLAAADAVMEDSPTTKLEHTQPAQPPTSRFNVPIAAQPQPTLMQSPFVPTTQPPLVQSHGATPPGSQPLTQPVTQTMSPRPMRAPFAFGEREREVPPQQPSGRVPLGQKPAPTGPPPASEAPMSRHPLPTSLMEPQSERPKAEPKAPKEQPRQQLRVKQEPDLIHHQYDHFVPQAQTARMSSRSEGVPLSRPPEPPRAVAPAPQVPVQGSFATILQQQHGRGLLSESNPSSPARSRPVSTLSRPASGASGIAEPFSAPPAQHTPPAVAPPPPRPAERKTSNLMALLNDEPPPPPPKRVAEVPAAAKPSSTPPPQSNLSRPPPPPPPPSHIRRDPVAPEAQNYYGRNPPPPPSSMPPLKPYTSASPQAQPLNAPRHMQIDATAERDYYGGRPRSFPSPHQPPAAGSPQSTHHYPPPNQPSQMSYQPQTSYPYGAQVQPPNVASPPPQYGGHSASRGHEPQPSRDVGWPGAHQGHPLQQQHPQPQPPPQQQPTWSSHPPQPPKSTQPPPTQSAWAAQQPTPKPPPPSSSVPPQPSWASAPPPRGHDPMALRDVRDVYPPHRMQPPLQQYAPASRAPEPPPQAPAAYPRYANTPVPGRDPRDPGPPRSYTPVNAYDSRAYPAPSAQDMREAQLREQQQQSILQQQLRPQDRHNLYDRPPPDRYGR